MNSEQEGKDCEVPNTLCCPITHELMVDPYIDREGNTYEKTAIFHWLAKKKESPITRNELREHELRPNRALKELCDEYRQKHPVKKQLKSVVEDIVDQLVDTENDQFVTNDVENVKIDVAGYADEYVLVSLKPPEGQHKTPLDLCVVVDVSGSMGDEAKMKDNTGKTETYGLSLLDVVKHSVKTIIKNLDSNDRLSLVTFSTQGKVVFGLRKMDVSGRKRAIAKIEKLQPDSQTNIWDGLYKGLEVLRTEESRGAKKHIILLTDGQPNVCPPRGHLPMLRKYKDKNKSLSCTISCVGFGYNLDSPLLEELSVEGNGVYAFIPDSSFVGTVFVNALSNLMATMGTNSTLLIETDAEVEVNGGFSHTKTSWGVSINVGSLYYEQTKDVVVSLKVPKSEGFEKLEMNVQLEYDDVNDKKRVVKSECAQLKNSKMSPDVLAHYYRLKFIDTIREAMECGTLVGGEKLLKELSDEIKLSKVGHLPFVKELRKDLDGEVLMSFKKSKDYNRWGKHYLPSLMTAHQQQICNNFKDPGVQEYGGSVFENCRDKCDEVFVKLPPPKPSIKKTRSTNRPLRNMNVFYNRCGGCFSGKCTVVMANGELKKISEITKGEKLKNLNGSEPAVVKCVVRTKCVDRKFQMVALPGGLEITPWHPVRVNGTWKFPCDLAKTYWIENLDYVYDFVLTAGHVCLINGVEVVTLGHGLKGKCVEHEYLGTQGVIEDLKKLEGWKNGLVDLTSVKSFVRDIKSGHVTGFKLGTVSV